MKERGNKMAFTLDDTEKQVASIKVIGVGGGGGNALNNMIEQNLSGVDFIAANTDAQVLGRSLAETRLQLGSHSTKGLGAGGKPEVGREAAESDRAHIKELLVDTEMVFITAGMGGGTGTGAAPVIAEVAKEMGILTVGVVTKPFMFEGKRRMRFADEGITELTKAVDTLITIPNQKLIGLAGKKTAIGDAIGLAVKRLRKQKYVSKLVLILLTDGVNTAGQLTPEEGVALAKKIGLKIIKEKIKN